MRMFPRFLLAASALFLSAGAQATVISGTLSGTIDGGTDTYGYFGTAGADLTGQSYTFTLTYDTASTQYFLTPGSNDGYSTNPTTPGITASLTIDGMTYSSTSDGENGSSVGAAAFNAGNQFISSQVWSAENDNLRFQAVSASAWTAGQLNSSASLQSLLDNLNGSYNNFLQIGPSFGEDFEITSEAPESQSDVPEPTSLALMGAGMAGLGWLRRRTRRAA